MEDRDAADNRGVKDRVTPREVVVRELRSGSLVAVMLFLVLFGFAPTPGSGDDATAPDSTSATERHPVTWPMRTMGTYANVTVVTADSSATAPLALRAQSAFTRIDSLLSNWTTSSEVARLNRVAAAGPTPVHPEVAVVLDASMRTWRETAGAFDITVEPLVRLWGFLGGPRRVPAQDEIAATLRHVGGSKLHFDTTARTLAFDEQGVRIDLGGIAKGYAVDVAAETLSTHGITDALVDLSGNMVALGHPEGRPAWRIGIRDPRDRFRYFARLAITGEAISSSGQYEQFLAANGRTYGHIIDPRTGWPANELISVTVVAPTAMACDAWDTPLFVMGAAKARQKARERRDIAVVLIEPGDGGVDVVWVEEALRNRFRLEPEARSLFEVKFF
jgi:thiamine biosynthesis lipoprotein